MLLTGLAIVLAVGAVPSGPRAAASESEPRVLENVRDDGPGRVLTWERMLEGGRSGSDQEKLERVNRYFNQLDFVPDLRHWGRRDYWATPLEFLNSGAGDCEDFAVAKYVSLRSLGVPADRLRLIYAVALKRKEAHMVVAYFPSPQTDPLILDNLISDIRPASRRKDLLPVYSFNDSGLWLTKQGGEIARVGDASRVGAWKDLQERLHNALPRVR